MRAILSPIVALLFFAMPVAARSAAPEAVLKMEPYRKTVALRANIAGRDGLFAFDTAGGLTLLTPDFARKAGLKTWGRMTGYQMMGNRLDSPRLNALTVIMGGKEFKAPVSGTLDLMALYPKDAAPVDGLIALDIFDGKAITIDFPAKLLTIESAASLRERVAGAIEVPVIVGREMQGHGLTVSAGVATSEGMVWLELDSGNGGTVLVSKPFAALLGLDPKVDGPQQAGFALAGGITVSGPAFTPDMIIDGNIGMPFLKDVAITIDLAARRLWIRPAPAPR